MQRTNPIPIAIRALGDALARRNPALTTDELAKLDGSIATKQTTFPCILIHPDWPQDIEAQFVPAPHQVEGSDPPLWEPGDVPRMARFQYKRRVHPILAYWKDKEANPYLPSAKGRARVPGRVEGSTRITKEWRELPDGWVYLTPEYFYGDDASANGTTDYFGMTNAEFIKTVGEGRLGGDITAQSPYQLGADLSLEAVRRQITKRRVQALGKALEKTALWLAISGGLFLVIFAIFFFGRSGA